MNLLILGGTAFLGRHLVEIALARGHTVTLFNRGRTNPGLLPQVETLHGDRKLSLALLADRLWDAVVDTSGYHPRDVRASAQFLAPNVGRYVFISTISSTVTSAHPIPTKTRRWHVLTILKAPKSPMRPMVPSKPIAKMWCKKFMGIAASLSGPA